MAPLLPLCTDGSAYGSLLTSHGDVGGNTYMTKGSVVLARQVLMLLILLRSLRQHERVCRRPFVLLRGSSVLLPPADLAVLEAAGPFVQHEITPIKLGVPPFDKLHAWNLSSALYSRILVIDADAMLLRPVEELFSMRASRAGGGALLTMAHHGYDKAQDICHIPIESRGVGGFYVMSPNAAEFPQLVHATTRFKEEQTGVACFFHRRKRLATLPCPYFYDIAYEQHVPGGNHHAGCLREGVGRKGNTAGAAACNASAQHVLAHCTWERSYADARAVHFKGSAKPWRVFSCHGLREGRLRLLPSNSTLMPNDVLSWDAKRAVCVSRVGSAAAAAAAGGEASGASPLSAVGYAKAEGGLLPRQCCRFTSLIKAEWWHHYRGGAAPPSLGVGDSWVRLGRWVRNKTAPARLWGGFGSSRRRGGG